MVITGCHDHDRYLHCPQCKWDDSPLTDDWLFKNDWFVKYLHRVMNTIILLTVLTKFSWSCSSDTATRKQAQLPYAQPDPSAKLAYVWWRRFLQKRFHRRKMLGCVLCLFQAQCAVLHFDLLSPAWFRPLKRTRISSSSSTLRPLCPPPSLFPFAPLFQSFSIVVLNHTSIGICFK